MLAKMSRPIAEFLFSYVLTCIILSPDRSNGGLFGGGGVFAQKQLGVGTYSMGLNQRKGLIDSLRYLRKSLHGR